MKYASDFRAIARDALRGKWVIAVIVGLVAALLGAGSDGPRVKLNISDHGANLNVGVAGQTIYSTGGSPHSGIGAFLIGSAIYIVLLALVFAAVYFILGSIIQVGYAKFNLELVDRREPSFEALFAYFPCWKTMAAARFLQSLYVLLVAAAHHSGYHGRIQLRNDGIHPGGASGADGRRSHRLLQTDDVRQSLAAVLYAVQFYWMESSQCADARDRFAVGASLSAGRNSGVLSRDFRNGAGR